MSPKLLANVAIINLHISPISWQYTCKSMLPTIFANAMEQGYIWMIIERLFNSFFESTSMAKLNAKKASTRLCIITQFINVLKAIVPSEIKTGGKDAGNNVKGSGASSRWRVAAR